MDSIGRYDIQEEIGQGGMSVVYRGVDTTLQRPVAVKVLHEHLAKRDSSRQRFQREARAVARLDHENIIDVYDFSDEDEDYCYIVMEYIPGENLREFVERHPAPPPEVVALIGASIAEALEHAHEHGVIHRDLKPENIMVTEDGRLTLMDFGIAHVADAETMTQTGSLLGSPAHMAPEIIDGKAVNERSDVFSLGTVLYYLSTGEFPFQGDNPSHLLREIVEGNFSEPETVEPKMSRPLNDAIVQCLQREPTNRPASVRVLRNQLIDGVDTLNLEASPQEELRKYFDNPEEYVEKFEDRVVSRLVDLGDRHAEAGETSDAFHYYNRVLAYDPTNEQVTEALDDLHARERSPLRTAAGIGAGLGIVAGIAAIFLFSGTPETQVSETSELASNLTESATGKASAVARASALARQANRRATDTTSEMLARRNAASVIRWAMAISAGSELHAEPKTVASAGVAAGGDGTTAVKPAGAAIGTADGESATESKTDARPGDPAGRNRPDAGTGEPEAYTYSFRVLPLAANVYIDGERFSVPTVHRGVKLKPGVHNIRVESEGCLTYNSTVRVDGPSEETRRIVLEWKDAFVTVESDVPAVVYVNGDRSNPVRIGAHGEDARIRIPFGNADVTGSQTRQQVALEVRARNNMQNVRRQTVTVRPGDSTSLTVNFRN